jgi:hypothetical protein
MLHLIGVHVHLNKLLTRILKNTGAALQHISWSGHTEFFLVFCYIYAILTPVVFHPNCIGLPCLYEICQSQCENDQSDGL